MKLPEYKVALYIEHNDHKTCYETAEQAIENGRYDPAWFVSPEEMQAAIDNDSVWCVQWYPNTPVGFFMVLASTLEAALDAAATIA